MLPQGLQIMADQGFEHNFPVLVLPWANQPQISKDMRRYVPMPSTFQHQHSYLYYFVGSVYILTKNLGIDREAFQCGNCTEDAQCEMTLD